MVLAESRSTKVAFGIVVFLVTLTIVYIILLAPRTLDGNNSIPPIEKTPVETVNPTPFETTVPVETPSPEKTPVAEEKIEFFPAKGY